MGPASYYRWVNSFVPGDVVEATGINPENNYYYVMNPATPDTYCWVWDKYVTIAGDTAILPVYTPQPTPTPTFTPTLAPDFNIEYLSVNSCSGQYSINLFVRNTGSLTWKSIRVVVKDNSSSTSFTHALDTFRAYDGCAVEADQKDLTFGEDGKVTSNNPGQMSTDPTGHDLTITVTLYSLDGRSGTSLSRTINVTP